MIRFLLQRLARTVLMLVSVSVLVFVLIDLAPGEYFREMRMNPQISRETVAALRADYGLNQSLPVRYASWLRSVARGDLGFSFAYNRPVRPLLKTRIGNTLTLTVTALVCSWLIAIALGVWLASRVGRWEDRISGVGNTLLLATPEILIGLTLLAFALRTGWFPKGGMHALQSSDMDAFGQAKDLGLHLVLPVCALS